MAPWSELSKNIDLARDKFLYQPRSLTNTLYRRLFPREKGIQVYGSARPKPEGPMSDLYQLGQKAGEAIAKRGFFPVTGGNNGLMLAVAQGAKAAGGHTVGARLHLSQEFNGLSPAGKAAYQEVTVSPTFIHRIHSEGGFHHRAGRLLVLPGGAGTLREVTSFLEEYLYGDNLSLYPTQKQVVFLDHNQFFTRPGGLKDHLQHFVDQGLASPKLFDSLHFESDLEKAVDRLTDPTVAWTQGIKNPKHRITH